MSQIAFHLMVQPQLLTCLNPVPRSPLIPAAYVMFVGQTEVTLRLSPVFDVDPSAPIAETKKKGLEGIIMKQAGSAYESDRRTGRWLKVKNMSEQEFVIGGFTSPKNAVNPLGRSCSVTTNAVN